MTKVLIYTIILVLFFPSISKAQNSNIEVDWIIYLAVGPYEAAALLGYQGKHYDITQYSYPLFVGYLYTKDSKKIEWHAEVEFAKASIKKFAVARGRQLMFLWGAPDGNNEIVPGSNKSVWDISDPEFFDAAVRLIRMDSYLVPIRYERNVPLDEAWRPIFQKSVRINGDIGKEKLSYKYSQPVKIANDKLKLKDFMPTNWDPTKNTRIRGTPYLFLAH